MSGDGIRLLALDGGGVRGLSSLMILQHLMNTVDPESPPKPCDYFDLIGGTSTGGLIAIMLGRLQLTVGECIDAYTSLSDKVFEKKRHRATFSGKLQGRFDTAGLERAVRQILQDCGKDEDTLLKDSADAPCKVFVCATSKRSGDTVCLTSYPSRRLGTQLFESAKIWQACRATSAATTFFDPISIGNFNEEFVDGALGANNPVFELWTQAKDIWGEQLERKLRCVVSIGTGVPMVNSVRDDVAGIMVTLKKLATETERTAEQFRRLKSHLVDEGRYYRFNVDRGLEDVRLEESKKKDEIAWATRRYIAMDAVLEQMKACASNIAGREYHGTFRTVFSLQGVPTSGKFVNRPADIAELELHLLPRSRSQQTQRRKVFVLHGLGGIGKTQLAAEFARRHKATFSSVFWLDGRSEDTLKQSLARCANRISKSQIPNGGGSLASNDEIDINIVVGDVLDWLAQPENVDWLLIFDNVDQDYEQGTATGAYDVRQYLPGDHGSVLITSRLARLAQLGHSRQLKKVNAALGEAIFQQWRGTQIVMDEVYRELLDLLDGLPLALAQAASYLRETGLDISSYVRLYKQQWDDLMSSDSEFNTPLGDYEQGSVATTWTISFKSIEEKSIHAANLLRLWAFLDNKDMWYGLLQATQEELVDVQEGSPDNQEEWPRWLHEVASNEVLFLNAIRLLLRFSMIEAQECMHGSYIMHPVVHRWMSHIQAAAERKSFLELATMLVGLAVPDTTEKEFWVLRRRLIPHAERCSRRLGELGVADSNFDSATAADSIHNLGILFCDQDRLNEAEALYQLVLESRQKVLGPDHPMTLHTVHSLGNLYVKKDQLDQAETMYQRALEGFEKTLGFDHALTLTTVGKLGSLYLNQGTMKEAEALFLRAANGLKKSLGPDHLWTLHTFHDFGRLYKRQGRLKEAEVMYQRALDGYEKVLGPAHTSTLQTVSNLGSLYVDQDRLEEAETMLQRALVGQEKALGPNHDQTLNTVHNLGVLYRCQGRFNDAEAMYDRALEALMKTLGPDHTSTLQTVNNLGILYMDQGRLEEAETMLQQAMKGYETALGPNHTETLDVVHNLGILYGVQGQLNEAEAMYQRALAGYSKTLGPDHPSTLKTTRCLAGLHKEQDAEVGVIQPEEPGMPTLSTAADSEEEESQGPTSMIEPEETESQSPSRKAAPVETETQTLLKVTEAAKVETPAKRRMKLTARLRKALKPG